MTASERGPRPAPIPADVVIRPARPADARAFLAHRAVVAADERSWRAGPAPGLAATRRRFHRGWAAEEATILGVAGSAVVGSIGCVRERDPANRHVATFGLAVAPERRREGIGTALVGAAFGWAREVGVEKLLLSVYPTNDAAIALYRRFGFVEEGRLSRQARTAYGDVDEILMAVWVEREDRR